MVLAIVLAFPKIRSEVEDRRLDYPGMATLVLVVASLMVGLSWTDDSTVTPTGLVTFGVVMAIVFMFTQSRSEHPIMPLEIFRNRTAAAALTATLLSGIGLYGSLLFSPLFLQGTLSPYRTWCRSVW